MSSEIAARNNFANASFLFSVGVAVILFACFSGDISFWRINSSGLVVPFWFVFSLGFLLLAYSLNLLKFKFRVLALDPRGFVVGLVLLFFADWFTRGYSFLPGYTYRGELICGFALSYLIFDRCLDKALFKYILIFLSFAFFFGFLFYCDGNLIFSDDHPVFFYRLQLLRDNFPSVPVYNPLWQAGRDTLHIFATGSLNSFLMFAPLVYIFPLEAVYNWIVSGILFILTPWATYFAARVINLSERTAAISGILAFTSSALWYQWALKYGTLGFITSISLLPLVISLLFLGFSEDEDLSPKNALLLTITTSLCLCWISAGLVLIPLIVFALFTAKKQLRKKNLVKACVLISLFTLPWMLFFWKEWNVSGFLKKDSKTEVVASLDSEEASSQAFDASEREYVPKKRSYRMKKSGFSFKKSLKIFNETNIRVNPLLLLLFFPGLSLMRKGLRRILGGTVFWCFFLGTLLAPVFTQIELDRFLIIFYFLLSLPVALVFDVFLGRKDLYGSRVSAAILMSFLLVGVLTTASVVKNRTILKFSVVGDEFEEVLIFLAEHGDPSGRLLFSGSCLHDLDSGHLAPLPMFVDIPMIASSHLHNLWQYKQVFPESVMAGGDTARWEYQDLLNIKMVAAHEPVWADYFAARPQQYMKIGEAGKFTFFSRVVEQLDYFIEGNGEVIDQSSSGVKLRLDGSEAVVKFTFYPHLKSECDISPYRAKYGLNFVKLSNCPVGEVVSIQNQGFFARLFSSTEISRSEN